MGLLLSFFDNYDKSVIFASMKTIFLKDGEMPEIPPCVATIGFFDGVHRGHRWLILHVMEQAKARGLKSAVITFDRHPRQVLQQDYQPQLLTTFDEKLKHLSHNPIDYCVVVPFTPELAAMSAQQFMQEVLVQKLQVRHLVVGYDHRFGHDRSEGFSDYQRYGQELGITVEQWDDVYENRGKNVSSSLVRQYLREGEMEQAGECLGYYYEMRGRVIHGHQIGRQLGFPTANIEVASEKLIPAAGVYAVQAWTEGSLLPWPAMMNIGVRPTVGDGLLALEVHIFGFSGILYDQQLEVHLLHRMREERHFSGFAELADHLQEDAEAVKAYFRKEYPEWTGGHALR